MATNVIVTVILYNTPLPLPCKLGCAGISCRWNRFMMAAAWCLVHCLHHLIQVDCVFQDRTNPLDMCDDIELFQHLRFSCRELLEVINNFEDDATFKRKPFFFFFSFFTLSMVQGMLPVVFRTSLMFAHASAFFWFVTALVCFDRDRVLLSVYWETSVHSCISVKLLFQFLLIMAQSSSITATL